MTAADVTDYFVLLVEDYHRDMEHAKNTGESVTWKECKAPRCRDFARIFNGTPQFEQVRCDCGHVHYHQKGV